MNMRCFFPFFFFLDQEGLTDRDDGWRFYFYFLIFLFEYLTGNEDRMGQAHIGGNDRMMWLEMVRILTTIYCVIILRGNF